MCHLTHAVLSSSTGSHFAFKTSDSVAFFWEKLWGTYLLSAFLVYLFEKCCVKIRFHNRVLTVLLILLVAYANDINVQRLIFVRYDKVE